MTLRELVAAARAMGATPTAIRLLELAAEQDEHPDSERLCVQLDALCSRLEDEATAQIPCDCGIPHELRRHAHLSTCPRYEDDTVDEPSYEGEPHDG